MDKEIIELSAKLGKVLKEKGLMIATAESCTGGGIAQAITEIPGSSAWFDRGFVTYSNLSKVQMLQVKQSTLDKYGAVSEEVAKEMVEGVLIDSDAHVVVSVTGVAGPSGGTVNKSVGTVYIASRVKTGELFCNKYVFSGDRTTVRRSTVVIVLQIILKRIITGS